MISRRSRPPERELSASLSSLPLGAPTPTKSVGDTAKTWLAQRASIPGSELVRRTSTASCNTSGQASSAGARSTSVTRGPTLNVNVASLASPLAQRRRTGWLPSEAATSAPAKPSGACTSSSYSVRDSTTAHGATPRGTGLTSEPVCPPINANVSGDGSASSLSAGGLGSPPPAQADSEAQADSAAPDQNRVQTVSGD